MHMQKIHPYTHNRALTSIRRPTYSRTHTCTNKIHTYTHIQSRKYTHNHVQILNIRTHIHSRTHTHKYTHTVIHTICTYTHTLDTLALVVKNARPVPSPVSKIMFIKQTFVDKTGVYKR